MKAYNVSVSMAPYCNATTTTSLLALMNGPPDMPTIEYFIAKGYKAGYVQPLEAVIASNAASQNVLPAGAVAQFELSQTQIAEIVAQGSTPAIGAGVMIASRANTFVLRAIYPVTGVRNYLKAARVAREAGETVKDATKISGLALKAIRIVGGVSVVLEIVTTAVSVILAIMDAEEQKQEIATLNTDLNNAKNNPPDLQKFAKDDIGSDKLESVYLELTLPEFESASPLPAPAATDPQFITNSATVTNQVGAIQYQDQDNQIWTARPYSQNWFLITGNDQNGNPISRFSNYLTYLGPDSSNNTKAYKAWINNGNFLVGRLIPNPTDQICAAGSNGFYQGDTTNCSGFTPDHLTMFDVNGKPMNVTMTQGVAYDSPSPANAAFTAGVGGSVTIQAHGIPAPTLTVNGSLPLGCSFSAYDHTTHPGITTIQLGCDQFTAPGSATVNLNYSNSASSITVPFTVAIDTVVHITSPTTFNLTYGNPVNFTITATGTPVTFSIPSGPWPDGVNITDHGNGTATIAGTPVQSGKILSCFIIGVTGCFVQVSNQVSSDSSPLVVNVTTPPAAQITSPSQVNFRAGEYNEFVVTLDSKSVSPTGVDLYQVVDACPAADPIWLTKTSRPNGDMLLSANVPFLLSNQVYNMKFAVHPVGALNVFSDCTYFSNSLTLTASQFPIFPATPLYLITRAGSAVPTNNFQMGSSFNDISYTGLLPAGVNFFKVSDAFSFGGTVDPSASPGDYPLSINANIINNSNTGSQVFHFVVAKPPTYQGFSTYNLVVNQPANLLIDAAGYPKNAVGPLPVMTSNLRNNLFPIFTGLPPGLQQKQGPMDGSILITGTPTQVAIFATAYTGIFTASNGIAPDLSQQIQIRVIIPGDINADGLVDCRDVAKVQLALNKKLGFPGYDNLADVNNDGIVNSQDLLLVAKNLPTGSRCP
jgi:hypothetical protein